MRSLARGIPYAQRTTSKAFGEPLMVALIWDATNDKPLGKSRLNKPIRRLIQGYIRTMVNATIGLEFATSPQKYLLGVSDEQYDIPTENRFNQYVEGSAELVCQMYDTMAEMAGVSLPSAEPAEVASYKEVAKMVNATKESPLQMERAVSRMVKRAGADTTLKNAIRDKAEFAWVPHGDTCSFCITLASRGWKRASADVLKGNHAEHIHSNCDCEYAIRFSKNTDVEGYDPDKYLEQYKSADGKNTQAKINAMRRENYAKNKDSINARKRELYAEEKETNYEKSSMN